MGSAPIPRSTVSSGAPSKQAGNGTLKARDASEDGGATRGHEFDGPNGSMPWRAGGSSHSVWRRGLRPRGGRNNGSESAFFLGAIEDGIPV